MSYDHQFLHRLDEMDERLSKIEKELEAIADKLGIVKPKPTQRVLPRSVKNTRNYQDFQF